jgi:hypothetical protein
MRSGRSTRNGDEGTSVPAPTRTGRTWSGAGLRSSRTFTESSAIPSREAAGPLSG